MMRQRLTTANKRSTYHALGSENRILSTGPHEAAWWHPGDVAKVLIIILCLAFLALMALHESKHLAIFNASYLEDGFCLANKGGPLHLQSHALSFYADVASAGGLVLLVRAARARGRLGEDALAPPTKNAMSLVGHGCGHLFLALRSTAAGGAFEGLEGNPRLQLLAWLGLLPVWYLFMRDRRRSVAAALGLAALHNTTQVVFLPTRFFFTHVLLAVLLNSAGRWLARPRAEKTKYYALESWLVDVPIALASFGEALTCDTWLARYGGHVWFDMVVPVMFTVHLAVLVLANDGATTKMTTTTTKTTANEEGNVISEKERAHAAGNLRNLALALKSTAAEEAGRPPPKRAGVDFGCGDRGGGMPRSRSHSTVVDLTLAIQAEGPLLLGTRATSDGCVRSMGPE